MLFERRFLSLFKPSEPIMSSAVGGAAVGSGTAALLGASAVAAALCAAARRPTATVLQRQQTRAASTSSAQAPVALAATSCGGGGAGEVALVDTELRKLVANHAFAFNFSDDLDSYVQPASIDLPLPKQAWLVKEKVLPFQKRVSELLESLALEECSLEGDGAMLLRGQTYLVHCGSVSLPAGHRGLLSPKSSIGRVDLMVRGVVDQCGLYDIIDGGERRELWLEISPQSFNVRVKAGIALTQLMVFADPGSVSGTSDSSPAGAPRPLVYNDVGDTLPLRLYKEMLILSLRVPSGEHGNPIQSGQWPAEAQATSASMADQQCVPRLSSRGAASLLAGYEAVTTNEVIDLSRVDAHDPSTFFRPVYADPGAGKMTLEKDRFYILATKVCASLLQLHLITRLRVACTHYTPLPSV
jgi:deoxycytidine triphosphate deaminase